MHKLPFHFPCLIFLHYNKLPISCALFSRALFDSKSMSLGSSIFRPYRGLGLVSSDVPFAVKYKLHSNEYNICVPVGARFNVYQVSLINMLVYICCNSFVNHLLMA